MCRVKTGKNVQNHQDLQNLVTSVILRQRKRFNTQQIIVKTQSKLRNSPFQEDMNQLEKMVHNTMTVLECNGALQNAGGSYCWNI